MTGMTRRDYIKAYQDYWNNYMSIEDYADRFGISVKKARMIVLIGEMYSDMLSLGKELEAIEREEY